MRSDRRRQGHATRAVSSALQAAFIDFRLHRVQAETLTWNSAPQEVLLCNGFRPYSLAPNYLKIDGRRQDHVMYQAISQEPRFQQTAGTNASLPTETAVVIKFTVS
ncbi:GNAT family N-acetyltransferase [uncultured Kocuria sp.]|uniref:GNAT family N-acetyltransferase n=1 Tax=Kocuria sp. HSID16901 TaxID=2419505 RepID=UPI00338E5CEB